MKKNKNFEEENEFEKLQTLLKELPKEKAPDNFEYNLMTRIHNQNFEIKSEKKKNVFFRIYTPAFALVASVVLIVFLVTDSKIDPKDPWNIQPKLRPELQSSEISDAVAIEKEEIEKPSVDNKKRSEKSAAPPQKEKIKIQAKSVASSKDTKPVFPFDKSESVDLDDELQAVPKGSENRNSQPHLAGQSNDPGLGGQSNASSQFDGFFIRLRKAETKKESLKIMDDSLKQVKDSAASKK